MKIRNIEMKLNIILQTKIKIIRHENPGTKRDETLDRQHTNVP